MSAAPLLDVEDLTTRFFTQRGVIGAVEDVSFEVSEGEAIGLVGESGSGKSVSALSLLRLVPMPGRIVRGSVRLQRPRPPGSAGARHARGQAQQDRHDFSGCLQLPQSGHCRRRPDRRRHRVERRFVGGSQRDRVHRRAALRSRIADPERVARSYPFQLSGGMQQRAVIAAAVARHPSLIIADEPTTALDATVQYQILKLLIELAGAPFAPG